RTPRGHASAAMNPIPTSTNEVSMTALHEQSEAGLRPRRVADALYHDTQCPSEIAEVRARVREIANRVVAPDAARTATSDERTDGFPRHVFDALATEGLYRIPFSSDV